MKTWTTQAERRLDGYLLERAAREGLQGDEAAELKEDLRRHVYEEAEQRPDEGVGLMLLENILGAMDAGYRPSGRAPESVPARTGRPFWVWAFAVVMPALVLLLEATTSFCGGVFFDPIPTWWHFLLVALVPILNAWLLKGAPGAKEAWTGAAAGVVLILSAFYGLLFLPIIHWSMLALIFFGLGLISLTPVLAWFFSWKIGRDVRRRSEAPKRFRKGWWSGATVAVLALAALEGPTIWTRVNLSQAASEEGNPAAIARLRAWHSERTLLSACYENRQRGAWLATDIGGWITSGWMSAAADGGPRFGPEPEKSREIFFRVTGKPFNSLKPPSRQGGQLMGRSIQTDEWEFDDHLGGDEVAVRLKSLDLKESRFDGHVDSVSRIGYGEWTMVFHNRSRVAQEARCLVRLPRDGRVSRLTLWVNGEPREAAFSSVSKVKAAYKAVAVVQRKDPVLVTMAGPDTVLVQCFPVPANGDMKIRFGVTAPLDAGRWELPRIVERNFGTKVGLEHAVWLQGDWGFDLTGPDVSLAAMRDGPGRSLLASLPAVHAMGHGLVLVSEPLAAEPEVVWCEDRFATDDERFLLREPRRVKSPGAGKVVLVIDGSAGLAGAKDWLVEALDEGVIAILADDSARRVDRGQLAEYRFTGGRDNEPALGEALRISKQNGGLPVVWVHGPQSADVSRSEALLQALERGSVLPVIHAVEAMPGPNRLALAIYQSGALRRGPTAGAAGEGFKEFLTALREGRDEPGWTWRRSAAGEIPEGKKVWDHLARLWAIGASEDPRMMVPEAARPGLAARYQLVTAVSGAVVLETMEQFASHGLTPVDADAAPHLPGVPEPSTGILLMLSATAALLRRKRPS